MNESAGSAVERPASINRATAGDCLDVSPRICERTVTEFELRKTIVVVTSR